MSENRPRILVAWTATHDNGWVATVLENALGTFSAWLTRDGEALSVDDAADEPEGAKQAALAALRLKTGHAECSARCTAWQLHTHEFQA